VVENDQAVLSVRVPAALAETLKARPRARGDVGVDPADSHPRRAGGCATSADGGGDSAAGPSRVGLMRRAHPLLVTVSEPPCARR
jgi:hypothetical protein